MLVINHLGVPQTCQNIDMSNCQICSKYMYLCDCVLTDLTNKQEEFYQIKSLQKQSNKILTVVTFHTEYRL